MRAIELGSPEKVGNKVRWRRMLKGRRWQSSVYPDDSRRNRSAAWIEFLKWQSTVEEQIKATRTPEENDLERAVDLIGDDANFWDMVGQKKLAANRQDVAAILRKLISIDPKAAQVALSKIDKGEEFQNRITTSIIATKNKSSELAAETIGLDFLKTHRTRAQSGEITAGRYGKMRAGLNRFLGFYGKKKSLAELNEETVKEYYRHLIKLKRKGENSNTLADDFGLFRQFIDEVSDDAPDIPKPKNLRSKKFTIGRTRAEPDPFTPEEFKLIYRHSTDRTKLYLLLMLNCSFYQGDLAEIKANEVDWESGRICRARSKKVKIMAQKKSNHDPIKINYKLWSETFRLLKAFGHREGLALRNEDGGPIVQSFIGDEGNEKRNDNVQSAYFRVITKLKNRKLLPKSFKKSLKQLRKTGPDMLDQHAEKYAEFIDVMLDHSRVANRSYLKSGKAYKPFDEALEFVGKQFGF